MQVRFHMSWGTFPSDNVSNMPHDQSYFWEFMATFSYLGKEKIDRQYRKSDFLFICRNSWNKKSSYRIFIRQNASKLFQWMSIHAWKLILCHHLQFINVYDVLNKVEMSCDSVFSVYKHSEMFCYPLEI